jgi:RNA polymerase-binding transcription factor
MPTRKARSKKRVSKKSAKKASRKRGAARPSRKLSKKSSKKKAKKAGTRKKTSKKTTRKSAKKSKKKASRKAAKAGESKAKRKDARNKVTRKKSASKAKSKSRKKTATKTTRSSKKKTSSKKRAPAKATSNKRAASGTRAAPARRKPGKRRANVLTGPVPGFSPYQPKRNEDYMSDAQLEHFRHILLAWKRELMEEVDRTMHHMKDDASNPPDPNDRATQETEFGLELRTRDRERKLLKKIDSALNRIDDGSYGYCEETGDEIGLRRLEARPVATLCVEAQERRELAEKQFRDREDYYR